VYRGRQYRESNGCACDRRFSRRPRLAAAAHRLVAELDHGDTRTRPHCLSLAREFPGYEDRVRQAAGVDLAQ
jgi:hypothetical protein